MNTNEATTHPPKTDEKTNQGVDTKARLVAKTAPVAEQKETFNNFFKEQITAYDFHLEVDRVNRTNLSGEETSKPVLKLSLQAKPMATTTEKMKDFDLIYQTLYQHGWRASRVNENVEDVDGIFESNNLIDSKIIFKKQNEDQSNDSPT